jgi:hypothetical protein
VPGGKCTARGPSVRVEAARIAASIPAVVAAAPVTPGSTLYGLDVTLPTVVPSGHACPEMVCDATYSSFAALRARVLAAFLPAATRAGSGPSCFAYGSPASRAGSTPAAAATSE